MRTILTTRVTQATVLSLWAMLMMSASVSGAPKSDLWPKWQKHDSASTRKIDHRQWDKFLKQFVVAPHASGINRVRYQAVGDEDRKALNGYLQILQSLPISTYNRSEQKAFWINLYNALTVDLILSRYPVASIRDINISPGLFVRGPWGAKLLTIEGEKLSLDDIEHRILRPIWKDNRVHYALNCASLGCPNLQPAAFTGDNTEGLLERGAKEFINHPRGLTVKNGTLVVSSIYVWFKEDFGYSTEGLMDHWRKYASGVLIETLSKFGSGLTHDYDWRLNNAWS